MPAAARSAALRRGTRRAASRSTFTGSWRRYWRTARLSRTTSGSRRAAVVTFSFTASPYTRMGVNIEDQTSQVSPAKTRRRKWTFQGYKEQLSWENCPFNSRRGFGQICIQSTFAAERHSIDWKYSVGNSWARGQVVSLKKDCMLKGCSSSYRLKLSRSRTFASYPSFFCKYRLLFSSPLK